VAHANAPRAVIWDVDGTLIDSGDAHWQSWRVIFAREGYPDLDDATFISWFGRRNDDILREHFGPDVPWETLERIAEMKESHYREGLRQQASILMPGVAHWLERLAAAGWRLGIASSAANPNLEVIIEQAGWGDTFGAVIGKDDVRNGKPDPEVYLTAAAHLEVDPSRAIVVEDAAAGVLGAHRAGMRTIGVGPQYASLGAMVAVPTLDLLPDDAFDTLLAQPLPANIP
jgi:beta-phosphoglucomutase